MLEPTRKFAMLCVVLMTAGMVFWGLGLLAEQAFSQRVHHQLSKTM